MKTFMNLQAPSIGDSLRQLPNIFKSNIAGEQASKQIISNILLLKKKKDKCFYKTEKCWPN